MILHCNNCGTEIHPLCNFCPFCGVVAPRKTITMSVHKEKITEGTYCTHCQELNLKEALYCSACGKSIYKRPTGKVLYCLQCCEKNSANAKHCCNCGLFLDDWFQMKGKIAERLGLSGNVTLQETMTDTTYHLITQKLISVGRNPQNDIVIPSEWVSSKHCRFDLTKKKLVDLGSTNGTFVNRNKERIHAIPLSQISELNVADSFTFSVIQTSNIFIIRLTAILEEKNGQKILNVEECERLRRCYFILILGDGEILVRKMDGKIVTEREPSQDYCIIKVFKGKYYFTDLAQDIEDQLILKKYNNLSVNWKVLN